MKIDWWTLGLQTINLLVLLWILGRFLFRPMARIVAERQEAANRMMDDAKAQQEEAEKARKAAEAEHAAAAAEKAGIIRAAEQDAQAARAALLETARQEGIKQQAEAENAIAQKYRESQAHIDRRANALAVDIAARLLRQPAAQLPPGGFAEGLARALASLPNASRAAIGADDAPVTLCAAKALSDDELAACSAAIAQALGRDVHLTARVDPALIAGLRLETPTAVVSNNFSSDLDRVLAELDGHDAGSAD